MAISIFDYEWLLLQLIKTINRELAVDCRCSDLTGLPTIRRLPTSFRNSKPGSLRWNGSQVNKLSN